MLLQGGAGRDLHQHPKQVSTPVPAVFGDEAGLAATADHSDETKEDLSVLLLSGGVCASCRGRGYPTSPSQPNTSSASPGVIFKDFGTSKASTRSCLSTGVGSGLQGDPGVEALSKKPVSGCELWARSWGPQDGTCHGRSGESCKQDKSSRRIVGTEDPNVQISAPSDASS